MTGRPAPRVHRCPGCSRLVLSTDRCACYAELVHLVTDLGSTPGLPGVVIPARVLPQRPRPYRPRSSTGTWTWT